MGEYLNQIYLLFIIVSILKYIQLGGNKLFFHLLGRVEEDTQQMYQVRTQELNYLEKNFVPLVRK